MIHSHIAPGHVSCLQLKYERAGGAVCEGSMRIAFQSELYAKGALCGSTWLNIKYPWEIQLVSNMKRSNVLKHLPLCD